MSLFGQIVRTVANLTILPVKLAQDAVNIVADAIDGEACPRTKKHLEKIKAEAEDE